MGLDLRNGLTFSLSLSDRLLVCELQVVDGQAQGVTHQELYVSGLHGLLGSGIEKLPEAVDIPISCRFYSSTSSITKELCESKITPASGAWFAAKEGVPSPSTTALSVPLGPKV